MPSVTCSKNRASPNDLKTKPGWTTPSSTEESDSSSWAHETTFDPAWEWKHPSVTGVRRNTAGALAHKPATIMSQEAKQNMPEFPWTIS